MTLTTSDKITLTKYPALPSHCAICLHGSDGKLDFVDFQLSFDYEGVVVICVPCWESAASLLGFVSKETWEQAADQLRVLHNRVEELQEENAKLQLALDSIFAVRPHLSPDYSIPDAGADEDFEGPDHGSEVNDKDSGNYNRKSSEPTSKRRSKDIPLFGNIKL